LLLSLQSFGMRMIEAFILVLVLTIGACYFIEIFVLPQTKPNFTEIGHAMLRPGFREQGMIYVAIGIIGATVMPHNLYVHPAMGAPAGDATGRDHSGSAGDRLSRGQLRERPADAVAGGPGDSASVRDDPAASVHEFQGADGQVRERAIPSDHRMGELRAHY